MKTENLLNTLKELDDWTFQYVIQQALIAKNKRNEIEVEKLLSERPELSDPELPDFITFNHLNYVLAVMNNEDEGNFQDDSITSNKSKQTNILALHSQEQIAEYLQIASDPDATLSDDLSLECNFHEEGFCQKCKIELKGAGKYSNCPLCGGEVYLT